MIYATPKIEVPRGKQLPDHLKKYILDTFEQYRSYYKTALATKFSYNTVRKVIEQRYQQPQRFSFVKDDQTLLFVRQITKLYPYLTNPELCVLYQRMTRKSISPSTVFRIRKELRITWKKFTDYHINRTSNRVKYLRSVIRDVAKDIPLENFVFIDETHVNTESTYQLRGYAPIGETLNRHVDNLKNNSRSVIGAINCKGLILAHCVDTRKTGVKEVPRTSYMTIG